MDIFWTNISWYSDSVGDSPSTKNSSRGLGSIHAYSNSVGESFFDKDSSSGLGPTSTTLRGLNRLLFQSAEGNKTNSSWGYGLLRAWIVMAGSCLSKLTLMRGTLSYICLRSIAYVFRDVCSNRKERTMTMAGITSVCVMAIWTYFCNYLFFVSIMCCNRVCCET